MYGKLHFKIMEQILSLKESLRQEIRDSCIRCDENYPQIKSRNEAELFRLQVLDYKISHMFQEI